jgi:cytochrome c oxidase cbb3-type subunit II
MKNFINTHRNLEKKGALFTLLVTITVSVGGIVETIPPFFVKSSIEPVAGVKPYSALELAGRDIYIQEGCSSCHSQMIRPFKWESARFTKPDKGEKAYSKAGEYIYDRPFLWGSKRTGPDLWRESGLRNADWHYRHFKDPQMKGKFASTVMPAYPWLYEKKIDSEDIINRMKTLNYFGTYEGENAVFIQNAKDELEGKTDIDALVAYMMKLGRDTE